MTIPVGNHIRDFLLYSRPPAEVERVGLPHAAADLGGFPIVSHGVRGLTTFEIADNRLREVVRLDLPHDRAALALNRLALVRGQEIHFYRYRKGRMPEPVGIRPLPDRPVEFFNWRDQYLAVRFPHDWIQILAVTELDRDGLVEDFPAPVAVSRMASALFELALLTTNGVALCSPDVRGLQHTNPVPHVFHPTDSPVTLLGFVRGRLLVGQENGLLQELRREPGSLVVHRSLPLPGPPLAVSGTKFFLFVACRNGTLVVVDWRDESRFILKHRRDTGGPFLDFVMYGEQGIGLLDSRTLARFSPTPGGRLAIRVVGVTLALGGLVAVYWLVFVRRQRSPWRLAVLVAVAVAYGHSLSQIVNPIEAAHFIEYGVLGLLLARALRNHLADSGVYVAALLVVSLVGLTDEVFQWLHPARTGDLEDVWLNVKAGGLMLIALAFGLPLPGLIRGFSPRSRRVFGGLLLLNLVGVALFMQFISRFGHALEAPGQTVFVSRLSADTLRRLDTEQGAELGAKLQATVDRPYEQALKELRADIFLYQLRVHLFRRDAHFNRASFFVAYKENLIIETYYRHTVSHTSFRWGDAQVQKCLVELDGEENKPYRSTVAGEVITAFGPVAMWTTVVLLGAGCVALMVMPRGDYGRRASQP